MLDAEIILDDKSTIFGRNLEHKIDFYKMAHMQRPELQF